MSDKNDLQHRVVSAIKAVAKELGKIPTRDEFAKHPDGFSKGEVDKAFGLWTEAVKASGLSKNKYSEKAPKFKYVKSQIESFHVHELPFPAIFSPEKDYVDIMVMPDTHVVHRDHKAVECFLKCIEKIDADFFIILGDFLDAVGISHWPADDMKPRRLIPEIIEARELLGAITSRLKDSCRRMFLSGNHEGWLEQAMSQKLPELFDGLEELGLVPDLYKLLDLEKFRFDLIPLNHFFKMGPLHFTHGLYTGANHPAKHIKALKATLFYGHLHDAASTMEPAIGGSIEAGSCACLCRLDAPFMKGKPTNWEHGFRRIRLYKDGTYLTEQVRIKDGKCLFMGQTVEA